MSARWLEADIVGIPFVQSDLQVKHLKPGLAGVYAIKRSSSERAFYVGQAACIRHRVENHEHGFENCYFDILETEDCEYLFDRLELETMYITRLILAGEPLKNNCHAARAARKKLSKMAVG